IDGSFYGELVALMRSNFYSDQSVAEEEKYDTWDQVPFDRFWGINKGPRIQQVLKLSPDANVIDNVCVLQLPKIELNRSSNKYIQRANYISYSIVLIHYDFDTGTARTIFEHNSERMLMSRISDGEEY